MKIVNEENHKPKEYPISKEFGEQREKINEY